MKVRHLSLATLSILAAVTRADAQALFASTAAGGSGELYILSATDGSVIQDVGPLNDSGSVNYSVTGLAFSPTTHLLYGSTGGNTGHSLLSINPVTAQVTVIGSYNVAGHANATMSDLAFDSAGHLYGIGASGGPNLYTINLSSGQATVVGASGIVSTSGGGLAISSGGIFYGTPISADFGTYNPTTGVYSNIGTPPHPAGSGTGYAALAFNESGALYGDDLGATPELMLINPADGSATALGAMPSSIDAIAFQPTPEPGTLALMGLGSLAMLAIRRRK